MASTGGRRPATRGVFAIEEPELLLPDPIALDTSFVVEALIATQPLHAVCRALLHRIDESGVSITTSDLLPVELAEAVFAIALKERWGSRWRQHRTDGRARPRAARLLNDTISRYETLLLSIDHVPVPLGDTTSSARSLMTSYGLASYDAIHAASAVATGAEAIVTLDTGFALLPAPLLTIYTDMDAASTFGIDCTQARAMRRLILADGNAQRVVADFAAQHRRRSDRRTARCQVTAPPRIFGARANAFAGCGCPRCCERLVTHMQPYIAKLISKPYFAYLDRDEARAEANLELIQSIETWPGGNFTGWFAAGFDTRVKQIYRSRPIEQDGMLSLDAPGVLANDDGGRTVSLGEQVPDRSVDVLSIVIWREQLAEAALEQRQRCADRGQEFNEHHPGTQTPRAPRQQLRLVSSKSTPANLAQTQLSRKAA